MSRPPPGRTSGGESPECLPVDGLDAEAQASGVDIIAF